MGTPSSALRVTPGVFLAGLFGALWRRGVKSIFIYNPTFDASLVAAGKSFVPQAKDFGLHPTFSVVSDEFGASRSLSRGLHAAIGWGCACIDQQDLVLAKPLVLSPHEVFFNSLAEVFLKEYR